jgi:hypothetical protein
MTGLKSAKNIRRGTKQGRNPQDLQSRRGQTLRLNPEAWRELKLLALEHEVAAHQLLIEAVNDLFQKYGKSRKA